MTRTYLKVQNAAVGMFLTKISQALSKVPSPLAVPIACIQ